MTKLRVALVAHHANPEWGSEPLIGWQWAQFLDPLVDLILITHVRNRPAIGRARPLEGALHTIDTEQLAARVNRINDRFLPKSAVLNRSFLEALSLRAFDREATRIIAALHATKAIDIIHRVSPISVRATTRLGSLGIPLVLGPLNGGLTTAPGFPAIAATERAWLQRLRGLSGLTDWRHETFRWARSLFVATRAARAALPSSERARAILQSENGVDLARFPAVPPRSGPGLRVLYLGRLLPCKGVRFVLEAVARIPECHGIILDIVGDGPDRELVEMYLRDPRLRGRVHYHGAVPVSAVPSHMAACDVLCLPSVRESGGGVVLEAMATARPVIVMNYGGPAELVSREWGVALDAGSDEELVSGLVNACLDLGRDPERRVRLGNAGRAEVERQHSWEHRATGMVKHYEQILAAKQEGSMPCRR